MVRLLQRAGAWGAASVALFFSALVLAETMTMVNVNNVSKVENKGSHFEATYRIQRKFATNHPTYPGKVDYVDRRLSISKRGNPMRWVRKMPWEVGVMAAVAAAGYAIDELTDQVGTYDASGVVTSQWVATKYNGLKGYGQTAYDACSAIGYDDANPDVGKCITSNGDLAGNLVFEDPCVDGVGICGQPANEVFVPLPYEEVWPLVNPQIDTATDPELTHLAVDPAGNPYIYPEVKTAADDIATDIGAQPLPEEWVVEDPLEGQGYGTEESPTPEVEHESEFEIPDDYAREKTLADLFTEVKEFFDTSEIDLEPDVHADTPTDSIYDDLTGQTLPGLPGTINTPDFGLDSSSSCETITLNWNGASVVFPSSAQCAKLNTAKQMIGWLIYVFTWFGCIYTIMGARRFA